MTIDTNKIDVWVYIVLFIFVVLPFTWKKAKQAKQTVREILDIHKVEERLENIEKKLDKFMDLKKEEEDE